MRLKYEILWFEDSERFVNPLKNRIQSYLNDLGFDLISYVEPNGDNLDNFITNYDVDLILIDLNLDKGKLEETGSTLIDKIRNNEIYTEIIFYSGLQNVENSITKHLEGVFLSRRGTLFNKTKKIINLTIKKNQDIENIRGLFIAEYIDMVNEMDEIIFNVINLPPSSEFFFKDQILQTQFFTDGEKYKIIQRLLRKNISSMKSKLSRSRSASSISKLKLEIVKAKEAKEFLNQMQREVIEVRNDFAHCHISSDKRNTLVSKRGEKEYDDNECQRVRKNFLKHAQNLDIIKEILS